MTMNTDRDDDFLNAAFGDLRAAPAHPGDALMSRVLADAARVQPVAPGVSPAPRGTPRAGNGIWARISALLGARLDVAAVATAAVVGVMVGVLQPAPLTALAADLGVLSSTASLVPDDGAFLFATLLEEDL